MKRCAAGLLAESARSAGSWFGLPFGSGTLFGAGFIRTRMIPTGKPDRAQLYVDENS